MSGGTPYDNLVVDVARVFGFERAGPRIGMAIERERNGDA
jgi:hypothetical protein